MTKTKKVVGLFSAALIASSMALTDAKAEISQTDLSKALDQYLQTDQGQEAIGKAAQSYFKNLQAKAQKERAEKEAAALEDQFKNPVNIEVAGSPVKGKSDAKITIIEFSDFECPFCSRGMSTMEEVMKAYPNDVKVVFKNLPLPFHKNAEPAAKAALAAGKQGKFWEMHDKLFANQKSLSDAFYEKTAKEIGLDVAKFKKDLSDPAIQKQIDEDKELAKQHGISGTPGFFVNGVAVKGAYPFDHFKQIIDRWLAKS
ncbi:MAG: thioredoxin domain-containing protein [Deltaproteobacteria bacterium]|nr:thioredoxin domain-containing protein [Deltaproteobacteria bacterium]